MIIPGFQSKRKDLSWQLASDNYLPALSGTTLEIYFPRPNTETSSYSGHRYAHSQMTYQWPVLAAFGAPPYKYEFLQSPTGATIVETWDQSTEGDLTLHTRSTSHGVVTWTPAGNQSDTFTFEVKVTDQQGNTDTVTWVVTLDDTKFVFVDASGGNDGNAGTYAAPLQTLDTGLWEGDTTSSSYAGLIGVFFGGTYDVLSGGLGRECTVKPATLMAYPGESVSFDCTNGRLTSKSTDGDTDDTIIRDITFINSPNTVSNARIIPELNLSDRLLFWNLTFDTVDTASYTDNPACIYMAAEEPSKRSYIVISDCTTTANCKLPLYDGFTCDKVLIENNTGSAGIAIPTGPWLLPKDDQSNLCVRFNFFDGTVGTSVLEIFNQIDQSPCSNQDVCYNTVICTPPLGVEGAVAWNRQTSSENGTNTRDARNTYIIKTTGYTMRMLDGSAGAKPVTVIANAIVPQNDGIWGTVDAAYTEGTPATVELLTTDFDSSGKLTGTARTNYLGTHGAELAT